MDYDAYIPDEDALFYEVTVASSSDMPDLQPSSSYDIFIPVAMGIIVGVLLIGHRRF